MYDYKFRQNEGSSSGPPGPRRKTLVQVAGILAVAAALFALAYLVFLRPAPERESKADSNRVPLVLPPPRNPPQDTPPPSVVPRRPS